jgi:hypothetical protein
VLGVELLVEDKWVLIETKTINLTDMLYDRAVERGHTVRRVMVLEAATMMIDEDPVDLEPYINPYFRLGEEGYAAWLERLKTGGGDDAT